MANNDDDQLDLIQIKGKHGLDVENSDILSSLEFSHDGNLLAVGDRGGRIVILSHNKKKKNSIDEYHVYATFQSHESDFDYLKSVEIEEKINKICWLSPSYDCHYLMTTNDKTPKLFSIRDNATKISRNGSADSYSSEENVPLKGRNFSRQSSAGSFNRKDIRSRRDYKNAHHYNINSISICSNQEYFISTDDLRINLWSLERNDTCFTIVDIKPENMDLLSEIITSSIYHPTSPDIFLYSTSKGSIKLCDTRLSALCDRPTLVFEDDESELKSSRYAEAIFSIGSVEYNKNPRYFVTRNYLEIKIWDSNMNKKPLESIPVQNFLNSNDILGELYDQDLIFDKFDISISHDDKYIITGSYDDLFAINKLESDKNVWKQNYYLPQPENVRYRLLGHQVYEPITILTEGCTKKSSRKNRCFSVNEIKFKNKVTSLDFHPTDSLLAVALRQNLLIFNTKPSI